MSDGLFILTHHPKKLKIYVSGKINYDSIRKALRTASFHRRDVLRDDPERFAAYLIRELLRLKTHVRVDPVSNKCALRIEISLQQNAPRIKILQSIARWENPVICDDYLFRFLGNSELRDTSSQRRHKQTRQGRLDWFREKYKERHGYYPHEEQDDSVKRYDPMQVRLRDINESNKQRSANIASAMRRRARRAILIRRKGEKPPRPFSIKEHYETPPDEVK